ncbi:MAG: LamG-like jellyroll fold domain-containing protein, partial [Luteolibacter sp.]
VKNGDIQSIWIDGREAARGLGGPLPQDFTAFWIGSRESHGTVPTSPGAIDDLAVLGIALRPDQIAALARGSTPETILIDRDADGDRLPDSYELHHRLSVSAPDAAADPDDDGLNNLAEFQLMTDPDNSDSDKDGLSDGLEANSQTSSTEALIRDTDQDGLTDGDETTTQLRGPAYRSHPLAFDTDGDGFSDGVEAAFACDPSNASSKPMASTGPVLAAYWDFDAAEEPWKDGISGVSANPSATCQLVRGPKGGAVRFRGGVGIQVPAPQFSQLAAAMNTMVISFWSKRWKPSRGTSVFLESPSSPGAIGIRIHSPWKDGSVIFDTPRDPGFRGTSRGWVPAHAVGFDATAEAEQWHHFLFSIHEQKKEIWIDGRCVYQGEAGPLPRDLADLWIGGPPESLGISGLIDEFAIFLSPLNGDAIKRLHQGVKPTAIAAECLAPSY